MKLDRIGFSSVLLLVLFNYPAAGAGTCSTKVLSDQPRWISSVEVDSDVLYIADPKRSELLAYDTTTGSMRSVPVPGDLAPASITKVQGGLLVKDGDDAVIFNPGTKDIGPRINLRQSGSNQTGLRSLYSNWATRGSTFLGFGSVAHMDLASGKYDPSRGFELGFVTGKVGENVGQFRDIKMLQATNENQLYLFGFPYFAANDDGLFLVNMTGERASIQQLGKDPGGRPVLKELKAFPERYRKILKLKTPSLGPSTTAARFAEIENAKIVVGLFGQGHLLYLLTRQPDQSGEGTEWLLFQINPKESRPQGAVRLPTKASHLSIVPGSNFWYLIERGEVRGWGDQDIETLIHIPTGWIRSPAGSPLNANSPRVMQCAAN